MKMQYSIQNYQISLNILKIVKYITCLIISGDLKLALVVSVFLCSTVKDIYNYKYKMLLLDKLFTNLEIQ